MPNFSFFYQLRNLSFLTLLFATTTACVPPSNIGELVSAKQLKAIGNSFSTTAPVPSTSSKPTCAATTYYTGYSKSFQPYKVCLLSGNLDDVLQQMSMEEAPLVKQTDSDEEFAQKLGLLGLLERTSLALQAGDIEQSLRYSKLAELIFEDRENESYFSEGLASVGSMFANVAGAGEYGRYSAVGYEKVLLLNLKALDYLLMGDVRAFNVARLGIQWQAEEKEIFYKELEKVTQENVTQTDETAKAEKNKTSSKLDKTSVFSAIQSEYAKYDSEALKVSSAFVNPFGDFLAGTVNEFKSVKDKSLLSNAHISYKQALELSPNSRVLKLAVKDTKNKRSAENLIQIVAFDGLAPEKQVLKFGVMVPSLSAPLNIELPVYTAVPSRVRKIQVTTTGGKVLSTLSPIANITALAFRHQKDMLPATQSLVVSSTLRDALIKETGNRFLSGFGTLVGSVIDSTMEPNTSSWMSLPSQVLGGRFHSKKGMKHLKVISYGEGGKQLAQQQITLSEGDRHLLFIRTIDTTLATYSSKPIWSQL
ncbi:hypothetical protein [Desulforhopalus sp. 52FAK]